MGIMDALSNIAGGIYAIGKGALQLVWGAFKMALLAVILPIVGIYSIITGIFNFAKESYQKIKRNRPGTKPKGAGSITGSKFAKAIRNTEQEIGEAIDMSDLEKKEAKDELDEIARKYRNGEISGMQYTDGENEQGQDDILDAQFFKASQMDSDSQDKNIYRPFKNA